MAWDPLKSPDIDALITTDIRSGITDVLREFDIFDSEKITDHVLRAAVALHDEPRTFGTTGIFVNSAPRTVENNNGEPFYVATTDNGIRVVTTPLTVLSAIRERIISLQYLPNDRENGLYKSKREQFRSSFTVRLLAYNHGIPLIEADPKIIPEPSKELQLSYVDRFGNIVIDTLVNLIREKIGETIGLNINGVSREATVGISLGESKPGSLVVYQNDGHIEVVAKWDPRWDSKAKFENSAWAQFAKPRLGAHVKIL